MGDDNDNGKDDVKLILRDDISDLVTLEFCHLFPLVFEGMMSRLVYEWFLFFQDGVNIMVIIIIDCGISVIRVIMQTMIINLMITVSMILMKYYISVTDRSLSVQTGALG